jgi:hypothetical protein
LSAFDAPVVLNPATGIIADYNDLFDGSWQQLPGLVVGIDLVCWRFAEALVGKLREDDGADRGPRS